MSGEVSSPAPAGYQLCPHCFAQFGKNDALFRRKLARDVPDLRQQQLFGVLNAGAQQPGWSYAAADWRSYPAERRDVQDGIVRRLLDASQDVLQTRLCPFCRYPLAEPDAESLVLLSWREGEIEVSRAAELFGTLAARSAAWRVSDLAPAPFRNPGRLLLARAGNGAELLLPVGLCCAGDPAALLQQRYVLKAAAAALWIDAREESAPDRDDAGVWSLLRYLDAECSRGAPSRRPLAVFLETERLFPGGQAEFQTWLESGHARLLGALRVHVRDFAVFPWNADKLAVGEKAAAWLLEASDIEPPASAPPTGGKIIPGPAPDLPTPEFRE